MNRYDYDTETDFLNHEKATWGEDYIESLIEQGYEPLFTTVGWKWIQPTAKQRRLITA